VLLIAFALALPLLRWPRLLLVVSALPYAMVRITGLNLWSWTGDGWFFDPFAWQFLFMIGAVLAYAPPRMPRRRWPLDVAAVTVLLAGAIVIWVIDEHTAVSDRIPEVLMRLVVTEDKTGLHPFRLFSILALVWLTVRLVPFDAAWLRSRLAGPLVLIGQNSLPVFCCGIFFGFIARLGLEYDDGAGMQVVANVSGFLVMVSVGALAAWYRGKGRGGTRTSGALPATARPDTG